MKNHIQAGEVVEVAAPYALASGAGALIGSLFGVAQSAAANGAPVQLSVKGVFSLAKAPSQAWTVGARIYWDDAAKVCTTTAATNKLIGVATVAVAGGAGDILGTVLLSSAFTL